MLTSDNNFRTNAESNTDRYFWTDVVDGNLRHLLFVIKRNLLLLCRRPAVSTAIWTLFCRLMQPALFLSPYFGDDDKISSASSLAITGVIFVSS